MCARLNQNHCVLFVYLSLLAPLAGCGGDSTSKSSLSLESENNSSINNEEDGIQRDAPNSRTIDLFFDIEPGMSKNDVDQILGFQPDRESGFGVPSSYYDMSDESSVRVMWSSGVSSIVHEKKAIFDSEGNQDRLYDAGFKFQEINIGMTASEVRDFLAREPDESAEEISLSREYYFIEDRSLVVEIQFVDGAVSEIIYMKDLLISE